MTHRPGGTRMILWAAICFSVVSKASAQTTMSDEEALRYVRPLWHGLDAISAETRARVRASPSALKVYAELLSGSRLTSSPVDTVTALWWLAESDDPTFVPIFLRYAEADRSEFFRYLAIYGLTRHAARDEVHSRLLALSSESSPGIRLRLAQSLMHVNDANARTILGAVRRDDLGPRISEMIRQVLAAPPRETKGRFPCLPDERLVAGRGGAFECGAAAQRRP